MSESDFDPEKLIEAMSAFLNLSIEAEYRSGISNHLIASRRIAEAFLILDLDDEAEPAPVFKP
jgi:hypothetical protein